MTNFQRSYSRVWWSNDTADESQNRVYYYGPNASRPLSNIAEESPPYHSSNIRRSVRSHDSGFNDSDQSPNTTANSSQISAHIQDDDSPKSDENHNYVSPQNSSNSSISTNRSTNDTIQTPPTVIRKKKTTFRSPIARRISFSAPNSPDMDASSLNSSFRSLDSFSMKSGKKADANVTLANGKPKSSTLSRGRTISPHDGSIIRRKASRRRILDCVSQVSGSTSDIYTLASSTSHGCQSDGEEEIYHHYESLIEVKQAVAEHDESHASTSYHNETVTFGEADEAPALPTPRRPLPIYDELYPPNGCSTPKVPRTTTANNVSQLSDHTQASVVALTGASHYELGPKFNPNLSESIVNLSLKPNLTWNDCTYTEYTNPLLNGNDCSVQFWLDETRSSFGHEVTSTLQTKSVLFEAAKSLKLNPAIASKLIRQIQLKAIAIETQFDDIERVFDAHAKLVLHIRADDNVSTNCENEIEIADNKCKEKIALAMKSLTSKVCQFMSKLNSKIIFQSLPGCAANRGDLKSFEHNVKTVIDMCQDLRVACDTKIDDIETSVLLRDFYTLKQSVLKVIRKVFRRLVQIIVSRIEENAHELLLRTYIGMITNLPAESVYNSHERFSSLNDAFISSGIIRVFLLICLDADQIDIRASSLRALATICSSAEMIRQFIEIGGLDVIIDILTDDKRSNYHFEPELREAVSVLTQVTAPWHHGDSGNIDDLLKLSIDRLVTRLTVLIEDTECLQTLMLSIACLNNLSHKSSLTFYSIMDNRSVPKIVRVCERYSKRNDFHQSAIFLYVSQPLAFH